MRRLQIRASIVNFPCSVCLLQTTKFISEGGSVKFGKIVIFSREYYDTTIGKRLSDITTGKVTGSLSGDEVIYTFNELMEKSKNYDKETKI